MTNAAMMRMRILSALVLAPVALAAVYVGRPVFDLLVLGAALIMAWEWTRLTGGGRFGWTGFCLTAVCALAVLVVTLEIPILVLPILLAGATAVCGVAHWRGHERPIWAGAGVLYIGLPTTAILVLRSNSDSGLITVLWLLVVVWATDIGAFFAGRLIGGPKLAPKISPNKTWAGLAGGILLAGTAGAVLAGIVDSANATVPAVAGGLFAVVAQTGDLIESGIKRIFGVKDASDLIPGHGGLMDRVDGIVAVAPTVVLANWLWGGTLLTWH